MNEATRYSSGLKAVLPALAPVAAIAVIAALTLVSLNAPLRYVFLMSEVLVAVLFATSLNLLMGYGGMLSLGHAAYYALGAYTAGILIAKVGWPWLGASLAGGVMAMVLAALGNAPSRFTGLGTLRVKESDRIAAVAAGLRALGGTVETGEDWARIHPTFNR